jgi:hypothetical protein
MSDRKEYNTRILKTSTGKTMNTQHTIYTKDKKVKITFRCDDAMGDWVTERAGVVGLTPSAFVLQTLYQQMYAEKTLGAIVTNTVKKAASAETAVTNANN